MPDAESVNNHAASNSGPTYQFGAVHGGVHVDAPRTEGGDLPFIDVSPPGLPEGAARIPQWDTAAAQVLDALKAAPGPRALYGPAGVGTSTVAAVVAERARRDLGWPVFWIRPGRRLHGLLHTACALSGSAGGRARELLWAVPEDGISWAREVVASHRAPALIIIDGADGGPGGNGAERAAASGWERIGGECRVLLTGRSGRVVGAGRRHALAPLDDRAAYALLHERIPPRDAEEGRALEDAVASCRGRPRRLFEAASAVEEEGRQEAAELLRTWECLDGVLDGPHGTGPRRVLEVLAAVGADTAPGGVPRRWCGALKADAGSASEEETRRILGLLEERRLVSLGGDGPRGSVGLDARVARCMRTDMGPVHAAETALGVLEFWAGHDVPVDRAGLERVRGLHASVPGVVLRADAAIGLTELELAGRTATERAARLLKRVLKEAEMERPVGDGTLRAQQRALAGMAWVDTRAGNRERALAALDSVIAEQAGSLGPDHPDTLFSESVSALLVQGSGNHHESELIYARIMEPLAEAFGEDHFRVLLARFEVAGVRAVHGDFAGAEKEMSRIAERCAAVLGGKEPRTAHVRGAVRMVRVFNNSAMQGPGRAFMTGASWLTRTLARFGIG
ncbi:hypothetical protein O4J56_23935 [Nocardiopsis sp. RSe5-2]|uniref:Tetratricopeptide repeat protein n=1 Tax=Nocardiopsis endophytica TaxID=3018445 RepID=A0ABT4U9T4_9ACTN|nr:hypothetical protein [Nocardiopsis endophytica]MDA2813716.1 hypothetical protein [Nocardiopsis endophytica]